jgi:hypothetical protein
VPDGSRRTPCTDGHCYEHGHIDQHSHSDADGDTYRDPDRYAHADCLAYGHPDRNLDGYSRSDRHARHHTAHAHSTGGGISHSHALRLSDADAAAVSVSVSLSRVHQSCSSGRAEITIAKVTKTRQNKLAIVEPAVHHGRKNPHVRVSFIQQGNSLGRREYARQPDTAGSIFL